MDGSMAEDVDLQQEVLQKTLEEVAHENNPGNPCVICLDQISEAAIAGPCKHDSFDFLCLVSWLQQRAVCPLCQANITSVKYDLHSPQGPKTYTIPPRPASKPLHGSSLSPHPRTLHNRPRLPPRRRRPSPPPSTPSPDDPIARRRQVYRFQLYSRRVGSNRLSRYAEVTPRDFNNDPDLVSRARKWIRRELQVFAFLNPDNNNNDCGISPAGEGATSEGTGPTSTLTSRRARNAEFLLEYIVAILRTVDIKGSGGQAEDLIQEFIGRDNTRLFLHELQAWLRSPYNELRDWDRKVQYDDDGEGGARVDEVEGGRRRRLRSVERRGEGNGTYSRTWDRYVPSRRRDERDGSSRARISAGRVEKPRTLGRWPLTARYDSESRGRRIQHAIERYEPD